MKIALTFDDGPNQETEKIMSILNEYAIKATFFLVGSNCRNQERLLLKMMEEGHEIGNHSFTHPDFRSLSLKQAVGEIQATDDQIIATTSVKPLLFRPPYGILPDKFHSIVQKKIILWTVDSEDWRAETTSMDIFRRVITDLKDQDIVLLHTVAKTATILPTLLRELKRQQITCVTVSKLK